MKVLETKIDGCLIIEPNVFGDSRGFFLETWNQRNYRDIGLPQHFVQDNLSFSVKGVLRGLHFQNPMPQGKLVYVLQGEVFDVVVDLRKTSRTFGKWLDIKLSSENKKQFFIPPGCAHGFLVLSDTALFAYKCTDFYSTENEKCIIWNDPDLDIKWPISSPVLSKRDLAGVRLKDFDCDAF